MKLVHYNVMLVEDESLLLRSLERSILKASNDFKVVCTAENGAKALELLKNNVIHLVITDINMPVMQGIELLQKISAMYTRIQVVLLTGFAEFDYAQKAVRAGALDYLLKPVTQDAIEQVLQRAKKALSEDFELEEDSAFFNASIKDVMDDIRKRFRRDFADNIDLAALSAEFGFSAAYLTKAFNKYEGCSPTKYITNLRMSEAKQLLTNTNLTIREVGERVGYADQFYFSNVFRKQTGESPLQYRQRAEKVVD